jgi:hypothetical protein
MRRTFVVVDEQDEYGEIILSLAALEVRGLSLGHGRGSSSDGAHGCALPAAVHCISARS